jgi:hypothetical protein
MLSKKDAHRLDQLTQQIAAWGCKWRPGGATDEERRWVADAKAEHAALSAKWERNDKRLDVAIYLVFGLVALAVVVPLIAGSIYIQAKIDRWRMHIVAPELYDYLQGDKERGRE